jgi:uncharacterized protein (PEP-CTERM system associated)
VALPGRSWALGLALCVLGGAAAAAQEVQITPRASVEETYTDNALSSSTNRKTDWITTVSTGVGIRADGSHIKLSAGYDVARDMFASQSQLDSFRHNFLGGAEAELLPDMLFLEARGALSQGTPGSPGPLSATERTLAVGQSQIASYSLAPRFVTHFGNWTVNELRYSYSGVRTFDSSVATSGPFSQPVASQLQNGAVHDATATVRSGSEFTRVNWGLGAEEQVSTASGTILSRRRTIRTDDEVRVDEHIGLLAGLGYDKIDQLKSSTLLDAAGSTGIDNTAASRLSGVFWSTGLHLTPNERTNLRLSYGHRYDGSDWSGALDYQPAEGVTLRGSYAVTLQTEQVALASTLNTVVINGQGQLVDSRTGLAVNPNSIGTTLVQSTFRTHEAVLGVTAVGERDSVTLTGDYVQRDFLAAAGGHDSSAGLTALWVHQLTPVDDIDLSGAMVRSSASGSTPAATTWLGSLALVHNFTDHLKGSISYSRLVRDSDDGLRENAVTGVVGMTF